jgi:hypothetical protein
MNNQTVNFVQAIKTVKGRGLSLGKSPFENRIVSSNEAVIYVVDHMRMMMNAAMARGMATIQPDYIDWSLFSHQADDRYDYYEEYIPSIYKSLPKSFKDVNWKAMFCDGSILTRSQIKRRGEIMYGDYIRTGFHISYHTIRKAIESNILERTQKSRLKLKI